MLIDHSRSFRQRAASERPECEGHAPTPPLGLESDAKLERFPTRYPRSLIERLRSLTDKEIKDAIDRYVWGWRQKLVLARRQRILERVDSMGPEAIRAAP
jgi:hypothetical protein